MGVYVDQPLFKFKGSMYCHMTADTIEELHSMANEIGLKRSWYQNKPTHAHYDLAPSKRRLALSMGAIELSTKDYIAKIDEIKKGHCWLDVETVEAIKAKHPEKTLLQALCTEIRAGES